MFQMLKLSLTFLLVWISLFTFSQNVLVYVRGNELLNLNTQNCTYTVEATFTQSFTDIALHKNGTLYGVTRQGEIHEMDIATGNTTMIHDLIHNDNFYTSMTSGFDGNLYIASRDGDIILYNPDTDIEETRGSTGYVAEGDLTFKNGELYMGSTTEIINVNLEFPSLSTPLPWFTATKPIWGIVTDFESCEQQTTYAMSGGSAVSTIYLLDIDNEVSTILCDINKEIYGATGEDEFIASEEIEVTLSTQNATCGNENGEVEIEVVSGSNLEFQIDGGTPFTSTTITDLAAGTYTFTATNTVTLCEFTDSFVIEDESSNIDVSLSTSDETCDLNDGSVTISIIQGTNLEFQLDGGTPFTALTQNGLTQGVYTLTITDVVDNCSIRRTFEIEQNCDPVDPPLPPITDEELITVPSAFSPNNNGANERFKVLSVTPLTITQYQLFDRWGNELFKNENFNSFDNAQYWNGTQTTGEQVTGPFLYFITYETPTGETGELTGVSTIIR